MIIEHAQKWVEKLKSALSTRLVNCDVDCWATDVWNWGKPYPIIYASVSVETRNSERVGITRGLTFAELELAWGDLSWLDWFVDDIASALGRAYFLRTGNN